jgi:hypothetical protein
MLEEKNRTEENPAVLEAISELIVIQRITEQMFHSQSWSLISAYRSLIPRQRELDIKRWALRSIHYLVSLDY